MAGTVFERPWEISSSSAFPKRLTLRRYVPHLNRKRFREVTSGNRIVFTVDGEKHLNLFTILFHELGIPFT